MTTRSPTNRLPRPTDPAWAAIALATLGALAGPSAAATFITVDRTVAGHNPIDGNYSGQGVFVGVATGLWALRRADLKFMSGWIAVAAYGLGCIVIGALHDTCALTSTCGCP